MKITITLDNDNKVNVEVDYDKTKSSEDILAEYSGVLTVAMSEKLKEFVGTIETDDKKKRTLVESAYMGNKFAFDMLTKLEIKDEEKIFIGDLECALAALKTLGGKQNG